MSNLINFANASFGSVSIQNEPLANSDAVTVAFLQSKIDALVASAPGALDTLNEIALALNNDPNLYSTLSGMITTASGAVSAEASRAEAAELALSNRVGVNESSLVQANTDIVNEVGRAEGIEAGLDVRLVTAESDVVSLQTGKLDITETGSVNINEHCYIGQNWRLAGVGTSLEFQYSSDGVAWTVGIPFVSV
jgi:hypothetical protein